MTMHLQDRGQFTRRTFLRGSSAMLALPALESIAGARPPAKPPVRMAFLFMPNGVWGPSWTPDEVGTEFSLPFTLEPLTKLRDHLIVPSGLCNKNSYAGEGHYVKTAALLSGAPVKKTTGHGLRCGVSADQLAARTRGHLTPLPSLELGIDPALQQVDMGYSTVYGAHVSWRTETQPAGKEIHPRAAFDRLFRSSRFGSATERSVLDVVRNDAKRLRTRLNTTDRAKMDEYLDAVRALETRIEGFDRNPHTQTPRSTERPPEDPGDFQKRVDLMLDLIVLAFQSDTTRIATFMFGNAVSNRDFSFLEGVTGGHHHLSHHENKEEKWQPYRRINRWHVAQLARMLEKMRAVVEPDGSTLLDHVMVFLGSGIRDGNAHAPHDLPVLLCGGGGGHLRSGRHLRFEKHTPLCHLYVAMLQAFGIECSRFGDADGPLPGVLQST